MLDRRFPIVELPVVVFNPDPIKLPVPKSAGIDDVISTPKLTKAPFSDVGLPMLKSVKNSSGGDARLMIKVKSRIGVLNVNVTKAGSVFSWSRNELIPNGRVLRVVKITSMLANAVVLPKGVPVPSEKSEVTIAAEALPKQLTAIQAKKRSKLLEIDFHFIYYAIQRYQRQLPTTSVNGLLSAPTNSKKLPT